MLRLAAFLALCATAAAADRTWIDPTAFEARVSGKTVLVYTDYGDPFGIEYFAPDRSVVWQYAGDTTCLAGTWAPKGNAVCYRYDEGTVNCLRYYLDGTRLVGVDANPGGALGDPVIKVVTDSKPPTCSAP
jgi:hypothetical protein